MNMRKSLPFLLVSLLLAHSVIYFAVDGAEATVGRGGSTDDFSVIDISVNSSAGNQWVQPDGSVITYIAKGDIVDISVEVKRGGNALTGSIANVTVEMVHPIGFVLNTTSWETVPMLGSQSYIDSFVWEATVAHSILDVDTNELHGGIIIRASVFNPSDDRNTNDIMELPLPVAIAQDDMEAEGDPRDQSLPAASIPTFYGGEFPVDGSDANGIGIWQKDTSESILGESHWRHANENSDYPSASRSRLVFAFRGANSNCGYGASLDGGLSQTYYQYMCKMQLNSAGLVSAQMHVQTWGQMGAGDYVALELWRGNGAPQSTISHNFAEDLPSSNSGSWSNISWDPTEDLGGHSWSYGLLFQSDGSGASSGMHVDDFALFGVEKVSEYTLNVSCDNPTSGYTTPPNNILPMYCLVTNNGYMPASVKIQSNVSNDTWMNPSLPMIRIDSANPNQHGTTVMLPPIPAGNTSEMWINLSIPAGAEVQQQVWQVWWEDMGSTQLGEMGRISSDIAVTEQYGVHLSSTAPLLAASLLPGEGTNIPFKLQNAGNREAGYTITSNFQTQDWISYVTDLNGSIVQMPMPLGKGQETQLLLNVTAPEKATPGDVPFSLRAVCPSCGQSLFGNDVISKKIEVPILRTLQINAEETEIEALANANQRIVYIDLLNLGNDDETYTLDLQQSNWRLQAFLSSDVTPVLDAWDGETTVALNLPMPIGLAPSLYTATIVATSEDDPSVSESVTINIDVMDTSAVSVSDRTAEQSYIPGGVSQSMRFEVTNDGNQDDRFALSMELPSGMNAQFQQLVDGDLTPVLSPGESYNVSVEFDFDEDAKGQLILKVIATSVNSPDVSGFGKCTYSVGSQNKLYVFASKAPVIAEEGTYQVTVDVENKIDDGQSVTMDLDQGNTNRYYASSIKSSDRNFWLESRAQRTITVEFEIQATTLENLANDSMLTSVTVWATSNTYEDAASFEIFVTLQRTSSLESASSSEDSVDWVGIAIWVVGGILILTMLGVLIVILNGGEEEEEIEWEYGGYEDNITATYGSVAAAPNVSTMANSAPQEPSNTEPTTTSANEADIASSETQSQGPPIPSQGLPEGWTMEQWVHYGQEWLDNNK